MSADETADRMAFIDRVGWRATTAEQYRKLPHEYTVKMKATAGKPPDPEGFMWFVDQIREYGYDAPFTNVSTGRTFQYRYLHARDGSGAWFKFWTMGYGNPATVIINREPLPDGPTQSDPDETRRL